MTDSATTPRTFTVGQRGGHWWFFTPDGTPFFSIGMNHVDSAALRYPENGDLWWERYGNSEQRWLEERVVPDLKAWGFNTLGWVQEVVIIGPTLHRHSPNFPPEAYRWADMPYCHMLAFTETYQREHHVVYPDVTTPDFEAWCDYVARKDCARMRDDPNLIGYFYADVPPWCHTVDRLWTTKEACVPYGPWFDPAMVESEAGRRELRRQAERYYQITHDAVRRYDPHHLILGDRWEGKALLPDVIVAAAAPYVDVLSFQYFDTPAVIAKAFNRWHRLTGKPVLLADAAPVDRDPAQYGPMLEAMREVPSCVGWHVCGAYLRNRARGYGFREADETPNQAMIDAATEANHATARWVEAKADTT
jgi:hypothetical protein